MSQIKSKTNNLFQYFSVSFFSIQFNSFMTGRYHIETTPLIWRANQWTGFYMITASVMKELNSIYFDIIF